MEQCKVTALANQKGGVGKTVSTVNLGVGLARAGHKVLLVDADPQGSLTISLGAKTPDDLDNTITTLMQSVVEDRAPPDGYGIIHHEEGVDLIPANIELAAFEVGLTSVEIPSPAVINVKETDYPLVYQKAAFTSTSGMERKDGSIGTVSIPPLKIEMKVWNGETNESMAKGLGHYNSTSGWDGNVGVCGHNRGSRYVIGSIKDLNLGDRITYTTVYGTRTYAVSYVGTISNNDWNYLQATSDNRITLTTCLANQPSKRVCVQAVEVK